VTSTLLRIATGLGPVLAVIALGSYVIVAGVPGAGRIASGALLALLVWYIGWFMAATGRVLSLIADLRGSRASARAQAVWRTFEANLVGRKDGSKPRSRIPAAQAFHHASIVERHMDWTFYQALPNVLVGAGIFFTFLGLSEALKSAGDSILAADPKAMRDGLDNLFKAASFKFLTSLTGLGASIVLLLVEKVRGHQIADAIELLCEEVDATYPPYRVEEEMLTVLRKGLDQEANARMAQSADAMRAAAEVIRTEMSALGAAQRQFTPEAVGRAVAQGVQHAFQTQLAPVFGEIREELAHLRDLKTNEGHELLAELVERLRVDVIDPLAARVDESVTVSQRVYESLMKLDADMLAVSQGLQTAVESMASYQQHTLTQLQAFAKHLDGVLGRFTEDTRKVLTDMGQEVCASFALAGEGLEAQRQAFESSSRATVATFEGIRENLESALTKQAEIEARRLREMEDRMARLFEASAQQAAATFGAIRAELERALATQVEAQARTMDSVQSNLTSLTARSETVLGQTAAHVQSVVEGASQGLESQRQAFEHSTETTARTFEGIRENLESALAKQAELEAERLSSMEARVGRILDASADAFAKQTETLAQVGKEASGLMGDAREHMVAGLQDVQRQLLATRETVQQELETFRLAYQASLDAFFRQQNNLLEQTLGAQRDGLAAVVEDLERAFAEEARKRGALAEQVDTSMLAVSNTVARVEAFATAIGLQSGERLLHLQEVAREGSRQAARIDEAYRGLAQQLQEAMVASNQHVANYLAKADERQTQFFESLDQAVAQVSDGLMQTAQYLAEAEQHRRETIKR
jgi:hypothetical protein